MTRLAELEQRLAREPDNLGLRVTVAGALREVGRHDEAVELYRSVAIAYRDQGRSQQAIAVCRSILEVAPDDTRCRALLASLEPRPPVRAPTAPPAARLAGVSVPFPRPTPAPERPPSSDETPLPSPLPYHVADPTTRSLQRLSASELESVPERKLPVVEGGSARPGSDDGTIPGLKGLANAARRITAALHDRDADDLLDTGERLFPADAEDGQAPPTIPVPRLEDLAADDDAATPSITLDMRARSSPLAEDEEDDDGIPTLTDEDQDEPTRPPRDTPLDVMIRTEAEGPLGSAFFQPLPEEHRRAVLERFHDKVVKKGTTVIRQGEVGHSLVVVVRGALAVRVVRGGGGESLDLGTIATGEFVGEASLLARAPAPAQVVAITDCDLLLLTPRDFYHVAGAFPALWAELKDVAERRTRDLEARLKRG